MNYTIKKVKNTGDALVVVQDTEDPKASFDTKNASKYLNKCEAKCEVKKPILAARERQYIGREMKKIYGIILGQCTLGI